MAATVTYQAIADILDGIDRCGLAEGEDDGWWENGDGADLGAQKLEEIKALFEAQAKQEGGE
jgi:hypothetical protein